MTQSACRGGSRRMQGYRRRPPAARLVRAGLSALFLASAAAAGAHAGMADLAPRIKPEAPGPAYVARADRDRLLAVSKALKARQFSTAQSLTGLIEDPIARSLAEWMYLMAQDPQTDFAEAGRFLDAHPEWPMISRLQGYAEKRISDRAPAEAVLAFFDARPPETGGGKIQLARALFAVGDQENGERHLRDAWINDTFTIAEEKRILSVYGGRLSKDDHAARVDRLMWDRQVTNARRVFPYLSSGDRKRAETRAALLLQAANGQRLYERLSEEDRLDSGVLLAAVRHNRRRGDEEIAMALAALAPADPALLRNGEAWWSERNLLMRWALKNGRFADAYALAAEHGMTGGADYAEAEFYAGWIALRFLKEPARAETHFLALASEVGSPISVSRAQYWLARAAAAKGDGTAAQVYYARAAEHYYSYYGQLAAEEAGLDLSASTFAVQQEATAAEKALFASRPAVAALRILSDLDLEYEFMVFAYHVDDQLEKPGEYLELAKITEGEGAPHLTVRAGKVGIQRGAFAPEVAYPLVFVPDEATRFVSPEIILGLSRQESEFNPRAYSRAGARGVMQLIPSTAQITARKEGLSYNRSALLDDPVYNMTLGSAHLSHLIDRFDGSLIMTFAGYNAGVNRVDRWVEEYGDPRSDAVDPLDWIELIPFSETRNYVQRVLENMQVYRGRLNEKPIPGRLAGDIERGGARSRIASDAAPSLVLASIGAPFAGQDAPPVPERTRDRARLYAMQNPPTPPADAQEDAAGPDATPVDFADAADGGKKKQPRNRRAKTRQQPAPAPSLTPKPEEISAEAAAPYSGFAPEDGGPAQPDTQGPDMQEPDTQAHIAEAAEADLPPLDDEEEAFASGEDMLPEEDAGIEDRDLTGMSETEYCLAYRDFLARNAEEEGSASSEDLNAAMLDAFDGEDSAC